jgi:ABC-type sugar transport system ATPase subunit
VIHEAGERKEGSDERTGAGDGARPPLLEFRHVTKAFSGQVAVDDVSFTVELGEVHALVGENGAGKTTLIKVLAGEHRAEAGDIVLDGQVLELRHPSEALRHGIGFIHQEPALIQSLSVAENLSLGIGFERRRSGLIDWRGQRRAARTALSRVGLDVDPRRRINVLSIADRQLVAVARILSLENPKLAIFDEATAALTETEVQRLFAIIRQLRSDGVGVIYVSHRLEEIFLACDRVTVMRNGAWIATRDVSSLNQHQLVRLIIGHDPPERVAQPGGIAEHGAPIISLRNVSDELLDRVSLDVYPGEILGLAGLVGAGRTNVLQAIFGAHGIREGAVFVDGEEVAFKHPSDAIRRGLAMVTEDRKRNGFVAEMQMGQNITLPYVRRFATGGFLRLNAERAYARAAVRRFDVRTRSIRTPMRELSGGNQQKTILARWLSQSVRVLLLDEPTHGVDVGAKEEIYHLIREASAAGVAVIVVSSELEELELLCSRVVLLREGRLIGTLAGDQISKARMLADLYAHGDVVAAHV